MTPFGSIQSVVFAFAAGMALVWTAGIVLRLRREERSLSWELLAAFAAAQTVAEWIGLLPAADSSAASLWFVGLGFSAAAFVALIEFGRRELRAKYSTLQKPWIYAPLLAVAAFKMALKGSEGLEAVCCYVLAPLGGLLAAVAIAQRARKRRDAGWSLPLAAAAIAFFALGYAFSINPLSAFASMGLLLGVWREYRDKSPLAKKSRAIVRWRWPAAFAVLTAAGTVALIARDYEQRDASAVVLASAAADTGSAANGAGLLAGGETDSRQLARDRAAAQRNKQALALFIVVVVIAAVWVGFSRLSRRM